jgi:RNA polymerase sigma-70 factor, ECF subfamily
MILVERSVIEECRKGDFRNFRKIVAAASPLAFSIALRMTGDEDAATDISQETMITVWGKIEKMKSHEAFKTWLCKITVNKCYDYFRKKKSRKEFIADEKSWEFISDTVAGEIDHELDNREISLIVKQLTDKLSPRQKTVFILSDLEEMTREEISEITGMSFSNIKANLYYARKNIGEMLEKHTR